MGVCAIEASFILFRSRGWDQAELRDVIFGSQNRFEEGWNKKIRVHAIFFLSHICL